MQKGIEEQKLKNAQEVLKKRQELKRMEQELLIQQEIDDDYTRNAMVDKKDENGHTVYLKNTDGSFKLDRHGKKIPVKVEMPNSSKHDYHVKRLGTLQTLIQRKENDITEIKAKNNVHTELRKEIGDKEGKLAAKEAKKQALEAMTKELQDQNKTGELTEELKKAIKDNAKADLEIENREERYKQEMKLRKQAEREEYIKAREQELNDPEMILQMHEIAQTKIKADFAKQQEDLREQEVKAKQIERQHLNNKYTLDAIASAGQQLSPETVGQVVAQLNSRAKDEIKNDLPKALEINKTQALKEAFKAQYPEQDVKVYNQILQQHGLKDPDAHTPLDQIKGINSLMEYTLSNLKYEPEADVLPLNDFLSSEGFRTFFNHE